MDDVFLKVKALRHLW